MDIISGNEGIYASISSVEYYSRIYPLWAKVDIGNRGSLFFPFKSIYDYILFLYWGVVGRSISAPASLSSFDCYSEIRFSLSTTGRGILALYTSYIRCSYGISSSRGSRVRGLLPHDLSICGE